MGCRSVDLRTARLLSVLGGTVEVARFLTAAAGAPCRNCDCGPMRVLRVPAASGDVAAGPRCSSCGSRRRRSVRRVVRGICAALDAAPRGAAAHRTRAGRARRIAHPLRRASTCFLGGFPAAPPAGLSLPARRVRRAGPGRLLKPRLRLQATMSERAPFLRRSRPLAAHASPHFAKHQITPKTSRYTRCSMSMLPNVSINGRIRSSGQLGRWWYSISPCRNNECVRRFTVFAFNQRS